MGHLAHYFSTLNHSFTNLEINNNSLMKKLIIVLLSIVGSFCSINAKTASEVFADVIMNNGNEYANVGIKLPKGWDKKVKIIVDGQKIDVAADSITQIVFWHIKNPDNKQLICWREYALFDPETGEYHADDKFLRKKGLFEKQWFSLHHPAEYADVWIAFAYINADEKSISFSSNLSSPYFFHKKSDKLFVHVPFARLHPGMTREWLMAFFGDDDVLAKTLEDKNELYDRGRKGAMRNGTVFTPFKYEDIADNYVPGRKN